MAIGLALRGASMAGRAGGMGARAEGTGLRDMKNMTEKIKKMADSGDFSFLKDKNLLEKFGGKEGVFKRFGINPDALGNFGGKEKTSFNPYKKEWEEREKEKKEGGIANENFKDSPKEKHSFKSKHGGHDVSKANYYDLNVEDVDSVPTYTKEPGPREMKLPRDVTEEDLKELRERLAKGEDIQNLKSDTGDLKDLKSDTGEIKDTKDVEEDKDISENGNPRRKKSFFEGLKDVTEVVNKVMELEGGESAALEGVEAAADFEVGPDLDNQRIQKALKNAKTKLPSTSSYSSTSIGPSSHVSGEPISEGLGTGPTSFQKGGSGSGPQIWDPVREQSVPRYNYTKPLNVEKSSIKLKEEQELLKDRELNKGITSDDDMNNMLKDKDEITEAKTEKWEKDVYTEIDDSIEEINDLLKDKDKDNGKSNDKDDNKDNDKGNDKNRDEFERKADEILRDEHEKIDKLQEEGKNLEKDGHEMTKDQKSLMKKLEKIYDFLNDYVDPLNQQAKNADPDEALMQLLEKYIQVKIPDEEQNQQQGSNDNVNAKDLIKRANDIKGKLSKKRTASEAGLGHKTGDKRLKAAGGKTHSAKLGSEGLKPSHKISGTLESKAGVHPEKTIVETEKRDFLKDREQLLENGRNTVKEFKERGNELLKKYKNKSPKEFKMEEFQKEKKQFLEDTRKSIDKLQNERNKLTNDTDEYKEDDRISKDTYEEMDKMVKNAHEELEKFKNEEKEFIKEKLKDEKGKWRKLADFLDSENQQLQQMNPDAALDELLGKYIPFSVPDAEQQGNNSNTSTMDAVDKLKSLKSDKPKPSGTSKDHPAASHNVEKNAHVGVSGNGVHNPELKTLASVSHNTGNHLEKNEAEVEKSERRGMKRERDEEEDGPLKKKVRKVAIQRQETEIKQKHHEKVEVEAAIQQQEAQIGRKEQNKEEVEETIQREETEAKREDQREAQRIIQQEEPEEKEVEAVIQRQEAKVEEREQQADKEVKDLKQENSIYKQEENEKERELIGQEDAQIGLEEQTKKELEAAIQLNEREGLRVEGAVEEEEEVKNQWKMREESEVVRAERESELRMMEAEREAEEASRQWDTKEEPERVVAEEEAALRVTEAEREAAEASRQWDTKEGPERVVAEEEAALRVKEAEKEAVIEQEKDSRAEQEKQNREVEAADFEQLGVTLEKGRVVETVEGPENEARERQQSSLSQSEKDSLKQEGESSSASHGQWDQGHNLVSNENLSPSHDRTPVSRQDEVLPTKKEDEIPGTPASEQEHTTFSNHSTASIDSGYWSGQESSHKVAPRDELHKDASQTRSEMSQTLGQPSSSGQESVIVKAEAGTNGAPLDAEIPKADTASNVENQVQAQQNDAEKMLATERNRLNLENAKKSIDNHDQKKEKSAIKERREDQAEVEERNEEQQTQAVAERREVQADVEQEVAVQKSNELEQEGQIRQKEKNIEQSVETTEDRVEAWKEQIQANLQDDLKEWPEEPDLGIKQADQVEQEANFEQIHENGVSQAGVQDHQQSHPHSDENVYPSDNPPSYESLYSSDNLATSESDYQSATSETYGQSNNEVFTESQYPSDNGSSVFKQNEGSRAEIPNTLEQPLAQRSFAQDAAMAKPTLGVNTVNEVKDDVQIWRNNSEEGSAVKELHNVERPNGERLEGRTLSDTSKLGNQPLEKGKANFENVTREKEERKQQENDAELRTTEQQRMNKLQEESPLSPASILEDKPVKEVAATVPGVPDATATHIPSEVEDQSNDNLSTGLEQLQRFQLREEQQRRVKDDLGPDDHRREEAKTTNSLSDEIALEEKIPSTDNRSEISPREIPQTPQEKEQTKKELDHPDNKVLEAKKVKNASETDRDNSRYIRKKTQMEVKKEEKATLQKAASQDTKKRNVGTAVGGDKGSVAAGMQDGEVARMRDVDNGGVPKQSIGPTADRLEQSVGPNINANDGGTRNAQVNANTEASGNRQSGLTPESTVRNHDEVRLERTEDPVEHRDKVHQNEARKQQSELRPEDPARDHHEIHLEDSREYREAHKDDSGVDPSEKIGTPNRNREIHTVESDQATRDGDEALRRNQQTSAEQLEGQRLRQESQIGEPQTVREVTTRVPDRATDSSEPNRVKDPSNTTAADMADKVEDRPNDNLPEVLKVSQQYLEAQQRLESQKQHIKNAEAHDQEAPGHDDGRREVENIESIHKDTSDYIPSDASLTATPETLEEKVYEGAKKLNSPDHQLSQDVDKTVDNTSETHLQSNSADMPLLDRKAPKAENNRSPEGAVLRKTSEGGPRVIKRKVGSPKQNVDATGRQNVDTRGGVPKQSIGASKSKVDKVEDAIKAQDTPSLERSVNPQGNPSLEGTIKQQSEVHHEERVEQQSKVRYEEHVEQQNTHSSEVASNQVTGGHEGELRQPEELNQRRTSDGQLHSQDPRIVETKAVTDVATTALEPSDRAATDPVDDKKHEIPEKNNSAADLNQRERRVDGSDNSNTLQSMDPIKEVQKDVSEDINRIEINASERMREAEKPKLEEVKLQENGYLDEFKKLLATTPLQEKIVEKLYEGATKNGANIEEIRDYIKGNEDIKKDLRGWLDHKEKFIGSVIGTAKTREGKLNYEDELRYGEIGHNIYDRLHNAGTPRENISEFRSVIEENKENFKAFLDKNKGKDISFKDIAEWAAKQSRSDRSGVEGIPEPYSEGVSRLQQETQMPRAIGVQGS